jgi:hypothetical protein
MEPSLDRDDTPLHTWLRALLDPWCILHFFLHRWTRYILCWLAAAAMLGSAFFYAWNAYDDRNRGDGNNGHATVDFGAQYMMARMMITGHGRQLYNRPVQREVLAEVFPLLDGHKELRERLEGAGALLMQDNPFSFTALHGQFEKSLTSNEQSDAEALVGWTMASRDPNKPDTAGPLYPPVHGFLFAPLGLLPPRPAYRVLQVLIFLLLLLDAWLLSRISEGRLWWPVAVPLFLIFPGFNGTSCLAQNPQWTITCLFLGWWQLKQGHPWRGGIAWGFLAYKPVWAAAFFLAPLLTGRWRFLLSMTLTGVVLCLVTLPLVGMQCWFDWLEIGQVGAYEYTRQQNWIFLSRDLSSIPRRWMLTFKDRMAINADEQPLPTALGNALWGSVVGLTVLIVLLSLLDRYRRQQVRGFTGPGAAFLLLGCHFSCFHFMYYDTSVALLPVALLFTEPWKYLEPIFLVWRPVSPMDLAYYRPTLDNLAPPELPLEHGWRSRWVVNPLPPLLLLALLVSTPICIRLMPDYMFPPVDTFTLLVVWAWCGWQVVCGPYRLQFVREQPAAPLIGGAAESDEPAVKAPAPWLMLPPWREKQP